MRGPLFYAYLIPRIFPSLFLRPDFVVGIPVAFAILRLALVTPKSRFHENDRPGILKELFFAIPPPQCMHLSQGSSPIPTAVAYGTAQ